LNSPQNATGIRIVGPYGVAIDEIEVYVVPEPGVAVLGLSGFFALALLRRRK